METVKKGRVEGRDKEDQKEMETEQGKARRERDARRNRRDEWQ